MWEQFGALLNQPTRHRYLALREWILSGDPELRDRRWLDDLAEAIERRDDGAANELMDRMNDAWALSPAFHAYSAIALHRQGLLEDAEAEAFLRMRCVQGLAASGDGTPQAPYRTTYPGDAWELLEHLGTRSQRSSLTALRHGFADVLETVDGRRIWLEAPGVTVGSPRRQRRTQQRSSTL